MGGGRENETGFDGGDVTLFSLLLEVLGGEIGESGFEESISFRPTLDMAIAIWTSFGGTIRLVVKPKPIWESSESVGGALRLLHRLVDSTTIVVKKHVKNKANKRLCYV